MNKSNQENNILFDVKKLIIEESIKHFQNDGFLFLKSCSKEISSDEYIKCTKSFFTNLQMLNSIASCVIHIINSEIVGPSYYCIESLHDFLESLSKHNVYILEEQNKKTGCFAIIHIKDNIVVNDGKYVLSELLGSIVYYHTRLINALNYYDRTKNIDEVIKIIRTFFVNSENINRVNSSVKAGAH